MDDTLILESVEVDGKDKEILLVVVDTGKIILRIDHDSFEVACHDLYYMNGMTFIMVRAMEGCRLNLFVPLNLKIEPDVAAFLKYWDMLKLQEVKMKRLNSFIEYLKVCRDFISENVDVEGLKPTYATEFVDNSDYGGSVFTYIHINISWGESWSDDFNKSYDLTDNLTSLLIDRKLEGEDDFNWFSEVMVQFRPKALDSEDFEKFEKFE